MQQFRQAYDRFLEVIAVFLMTAVTVIVTLGFMFRWAGSSLVWYDEIASISLAWLTYFGAALAALRGSHLGFAGFVNSLPANWRVAATVCRLRHQHPVLWPARRHGREGGASDCRALSGFAPMAVSSNGSRR